MARNVEIDGIRYAPIESNSIHIHFILDNSGSMGQILGSTMDTFNEYVEKLKKDDNRYAMTLIKFGDKSKKIFDGVNLKKVKKLDRENYRADGGMTALYDAVCTHLTEISKNVNRTKKNLVVILTDGHENASQEYNEKNLIELKKKLEERGNYTFVFLGANQDSFATAQNWGFGKGNITNFNATAKGMETVMDSMVAQTVSYASSNVRGMSGQSASTSFYTEEQQKENEKAK